MSEYLNESVNLAKLKTNTDDTVGDDTSEVSTAEDAIDMDGGEQRAPELNDTSHQTITGPTGINETKQGADTPAHTNKDVAISSSHKDFESPASPSDISSPELAVRSHISETLSKAFQDFDFGFDESGPVSDAEPVTASPPVDKDRVSSIQWEWKDPPESESTHYHEGPLKNMDNVKDSALSQKEQTGHPKSAVESFADREMPLAGIGASVVLSEVKPSLTEGEGGMYDSVHNIDELGGTKPEKGEAKSVSSDCSSVTASPPSSPVSDKTLKERSRLGKALAKRQVKSREKSKDKSKPRSAKRDKSKDKLKQKVSKDKDKSKDKKSEKNKSAQLDEANKSQDKANKKESEEKEKEKWKWPWQRRGSKKEVAQVASESDDSEVISKTGSKSKDKKKEKETQSSKPTISPSVSEVQMRHTDQEDIPLNEFNPCDDATKSLLESRINNPLEEHDYFNTFLGSSQCFQLPSSIESYIANQGRREFAGENFGKHCST
ncbi:hypothetical protein EGW08_005153 [Elysia chlorotica]|uniref:Uncharacterized protein n=1 Tax=Elysia chlorotica TaxID=188477 RepID=A0A3S0ZUL4_ELYCH|nr:hypothetical protein EGW08_005153 [Elysia chlorotica]